MSLEVDVEVLTVRLGKLELRKQSEVVMLRPSAALMYNTGLEAIAGDGDGLWEISKEGRQAPCTFLHLRPGNHSPPSHHPYHQNILTIQQQGTSKAAVAATNVDSQSCKLNRPGCK